MCAEAMQWGMSYEQFWHCDWRQYFTFLRSFELSQERKWKEADFFHWNQGHYVREAVLELYPMLNGMVDPKKAKKYPYPQKPHSQTQAAAPKKAQKQKQEAAASAIQEHNFMIRALIENKRASGAPSE